MLNINWFIDRVGQTVVREYNGGKVEFEVTEKNAGYLQLYTEKGYKYIDENGDVCEALTAGKLRVHNRKPFVECEACSA